MNIRILGLPRTLEEAELLALFSAHGTVESCTVIMDEKTSVSKGFAFVEMPNEDEAAAAIAALHGSEVGKQRIRVKAAEAKQ